MKIENNKLVFEIVTCWECNGNLKVKRYKTCPNLNKPTYHKKCEYCGSSNRYDHKNIGSYEIDCPTCKGTGKYLENRFDFIHQNIIDNLKITEIVKVNRNSNFNENYLGFNQISGCTDYGRSLKLNNSELINEAKKSMSFTQALNIIDKDNNILQFKLVQRLDGYSIIAK